MRPTSDCPAAREPMTGFGERSSCSERPQMGQIEVIRLLLPYVVRRKVNRVISDGTPSLSVKPGQSPVPLLT